MLLNRCEMCNKIQQYGRPTAAPAGQLSLAVFSAVAADLLGPAFYRVPSAVGGPVPAASDASMLEAAHAGDGTGRPVFATARAFARIGRCIRSHGTRFRRGCQSGFRTAHPGTVTCRLCDT